MNIHVDTLEHANGLKMAGTERARGEASAKLQARSVNALVEHELVTKDFLKGELAVLKAEITSDLRDEFTREINELKLQLRALQFGGAIAAFALGAVVLRARLIR